MADAESLGLTAIARKIFGAPIIKSLQERKINARDIWELTSPTIQCANTVGPVTANTLCWICGMRITQEFGMAPQCEHILPIAQAATYLKLYNTDLKKAAIGDKWLKGEYGWAHTVCNQVKSDTCPLIVDRARSRFGIDKRQIIQLLKDIFNSRRKDSDIIRRKLKQVYGTQDNFIKERAKPIGDKYNNIIDIITKAPGGDPARINAANLITLAGITGLSDISVIKPSLRELLNPEAVAAASSKIDELIAEKANWLFTSEQISGLGNFLDIYDAIQARIKQLVSSGEVNLSLSTQPKYREYFADIGINPANPLNSINPDNLQSSLFDFIIHAYPEIYTRLHKGADRERDTKKDVIEVFSLFILYRVLSDLNITFDDPRAPRGFKEQIQTAFNYLKGKIGAESIAFIDKTYKTYEMKGVTEAATTLSELAGAQLDLNANMTSAQKKAEANRHEQQAAQLLSIAEENLSQARNERRVASALEALKVPRTSPMKEVDLPMDTETPVEFPVEIPVASTKLPSLRAKKATYTRKPRSVSVKKKGSTRKTGSTKKTSSTKKTGSTRKTGYKIKTSSSRKKTLSTIAENSELK